jgi:hypothetical protein
LGFLWHWDWPCCFLLLISSWNSYGSISEHAAGFHDSTLHVLKDTPPESGVALLAQDPFFEYAFDELEQDNRQELQDVKKALDKQKSRSTAVTRNLKRKQDAKAKAVAKAKAAPAAKAGPPPAAKAGPPPAAAAKAAPVAVAKALPKAPGPAPMYGGNYEYIVFATGHIVFSEILLKINAHCRHEDHQTNKCHLEFVGLSWKV